MTNLTTVADLYRSGLPLRAIAAQLGCSKTHVRDCLVRLGVERRPRIQRHAQVAGGKAMRAKQRRRAAVAEGEGA